MAYTKEQREAKEKAKQEKLDQEKIDKLVQQKIDEEKAKIEEELRKQILLELEKKHDSTVKQKKERAITRIPLDLIVTVKNNQTSPLLYRSNDDSTLLEWDEFGSEEYMTVRELVTMRNSQRRFFEDNWITLDDTDEYTADELYKFLRVDKMYSKILDIWQIEDLFHSKPSEVKAVISTLSKGMKQTIKDFAIKKYKSGALDSKQLIKALEESLMIELEE